MKPISAVLLALCAVVLLPGCPDTGIICATGTVRCGQGCIDPNADAKNCGTCGSACRSGQVCVGADCVCAAGTFSCGGECVVRENDPKNCGACGNRCAATEVCEASICRQQCAAASPTNCAGACVNTSTNANHCGACGAACENSQSCHASRCTYDLVAACFSSGQVVGLQYGSEFRGPRESLGTAPQSLAAIEGVLLALDGIDQRLYQAQLKSVGGHAFARLGSAVTTANAPNQVITDGQYVFVANAGAGSVQAIRNYGATFPDGGAAADGGLALVTVHELQLGPNTYPQGMARVGTGLWVPLYGGLGATGAAAGQKVVRIDVTNPALMVKSDTVDLSTLNLQPFDGGTPVARPFAILAHRGSVYVALNNLNPDTYVPEGPGLLAKINPTTKAVSVIDLGGDKCLNPGWLASDGVNLLVSCMGGAVYSGPPSYALVSTEKAGVVLLDQNDVRQAAWEPRCPAGADGGAGCTPILPSRMAISGGRAYVGDQNGGRIFVLDIGANTLGERRGYFGDAGAAISACAPDPVTGIANVSDILAVP